MATDHHLLEERSSLNQRGRSPLSQCVSHFESQPDEREWSFFVAGTLHYDSAQAEGYTVRNDARVNSAGTMRIELGQHETFGFHETDHNVFYGVPTDKVISFGGSYDFDWTEAAEHHLPAGWSPRVGSPGPGLPAGSASSGSSDSKEVLGQAYSITVTGYGATHQSITDDHRWSEHLAWTKDGD